MAIVSYEVGTKLVRSSEDIGELLTDTTAKTYDHYYFKAGDPSLYLYTLTSPTPIKIQNMCTPLSGHDYQKIISLTRDEVALFRTRLTNRSNFNLGEMCCEDKFRIFSTIFTSGQNDAGVNVDSYASISPSCTRGGSIQSTGDDALLYKIKYVTSLYLGDAKGYYLTKDGIYWKPNAGAFTGYSNGMVRVGERPPYKILDEEDISVIKRTKDMTFVVEADIVTNAVTISNVIGEKIRVKVGGKSYYKDLDNKNDKDGLLPETGRTKLFTLPVDINAGTNVEVKIYKGNKGAQVGGVYLGIATDEGVTQFPLAFDFKNYNNIAPDKFGRIELGEKPVMKIIKGEIIGEHKDIGRAVNRLGLYQKNFVTVDFTETSFTEALDNPPEWQIKEAVARGYLTFGTVKVITQRGKRLPDGFYSYLLTLHEVV